MWTYQHFHLPQETEKQRGSAVGISEEIRYYPPSPLLGDDLEVPFENLLVAFRHLSYDLIRGKILIGHHQKAEALGEELEWEKKSAVKNTLLTSLA